VGYKIDRIDLNQALQNISATKERAKLGCRLIMPEP
jgi:hypothetical protein